MIDIHCHILAGLDDGAKDMEESVCMCVMAAEDGIEKIAHLIRSYFRLDGHHIQLNVVTAETLRNAQAHPEKYRDLIVRVAGYSDYFVDLGPDLQDEIIRRTEHQSYS